MSLGDKKAVLFVALPDVIVCESIQDRTRSGHQRISMISASRKVDHLQSLHRQMPQEFDRIQFWGRVGRNIK
jgi:hypothetical protein